MNNGSLSKPFSLCFARGSAATPVIDTHLGTVHPLAVGGPRMGTKWISCFSRVTPPAIPSFAAVCQTIRKRNAMFYKSIAGMSVRVWRHEF